MRRVLFAALTILIAATAFNSARAQDPQAGYYYPQPKSVETYVARATQFFQQNTIADYSTFLDFLKLLGFKQITITDGVAFAHQIKIQ